MDVLIIDDAIFQWQGEGKMLLHLQPAKRQAGCPDFGQASGRNAGHGTALALTLQVGFEADLQVPSLETRMAILKKMYADGIELPEKSLNTWLTPSPPTCVNWKEH